jgi:thiamine-monophosphate kinase
VVHCNGSQSSELIELLSINTTGGRQCTDSTYLCPMNEEMPQTTQIADIGEFGLIDRITQDINAIQPSTIKGAGDDAAVMDFGGDELVLVSTDMLVEGIHFDLMYHPLKHLGYKAVAVNISDICAMNGRPTQITVSLGLSSRFSVEAVEELYEGIKAACAYYKVDLVGGDTTSSNRGLILSITALGTVKRDRVVYRSGAREGDLLCITGDLGAAYLGLQILEREKQLFLHQPDIQPDLEDQTYIIGRQLKPEARLDIIESFLEKDLVPTSMIDISDGLASEIFHIGKASGVGMILEESGIPINQQAKLMALKFQLDPTTCALSGGEDYELLFTIRPEDVDKVRFLPDIYIAGDVVAASEGFMLHTTGGNRHALTAQGWQHFPSRTS